LSLEASYFSREDQGVASDPRAQLGKAVRERRHSLGLSQEALAERAGLDWTYIGGIERGERNVSLINIVRIARALSPRLSLWPEFSDSSGRSALAIRILLFKPNLHERLALRSPMTMRLGCRSPSDVQKDKVIFPVMARGVT
jgi:transcriptional regulator with XRE-family HTH domain